MLLFVPCQGSKATSSYLINVIAGVGAVAVAALVLGVIITYIATKQQTKRKLLKLSSREYKESPKLYQVCITGDLVCI